jgi:hypothetical protein
VVPPEEVVKVEAEAAALAQSEQPAAAGKGERVWEDLSGEAIDETMLIRVRLGVWRQLWVGARASARDVQPRLHRAL